MPAPITISLLRPTTPEPAVVDELTSLLGALVASGAVLGWVEPPPRGEMTR